MFLSTKHKSLLGFVLSVLMLQACGSSPQPENKPVSVNAETKNRFPFPTKEPEIFQGDFVIVSGGREDRSFVARKGDKWRIDTYNGADLVGTQLKTDNLYVINHAKKTYYIDSAVNAGDSGVDYFNSLSLGFFQGANYLDFEETGRENGRVTYKARTAKGTKDEVVVTIDLASGMMVREEITPQRAQTDTGEQPSFVYEIRNLKLDVDDSIFALPAGYKRVEPGK